MPPVSDPVAPPAAGGGRAGSWRAVWAEVPPALALTAPLVLSLVALVAMNTTSSILLGKLGSAALAAGGLGNAVFFSMQVIGNGFVSSVGVMVSQSEGEGRKDLAGIYAHLGLRLSVLLGLPMMAVLWALPLLFRAVGLEAQLVADTADYLHVLSFAIIPAIWVTVFRYATAAFGRPHAGTVISILGVLVLTATGLAHQAGLLPGFVADRLTGGQPVALGILLGFVTMALVFALYVSIDPLCRRYRMVWRPLRAPAPALAANPDSAPNAPSWGQLGILFGIGWPIALTFASETLFFSATSITAGRFSAADLAAHTIAMNCITTTFMIAMGASQATLVRVARAMGEGQPDRARASGYAGLLLGLIGMALPVPVYVFAGDWLIGLFLDRSAPGNLATIAAGVPLLIIAAVFQIADGTQAIAAGALRGIKDVRVPMGIAFVAYWPIGFVCGTGLAFWGGLGLPGLWLGMALGLSVAAIGLTLRFRYAAQRLTFSAD